MSNREEIPRLPDIRVVGYPFALIDMGEHIRSAFRAFRAVRYSPKMVDVHGLRGQPDTSLAAEFDGHVSHELGDGINLFFINGAEVGWAVDALAQRGIGKGYNIIYPAWELARHPRDWVRQIERFDEIWAFSRFIYHGMADVLSRPVHYMPVACEVHAKALRSRRYFSIPDSSYAFLFVFDHDSFFLRKNPMAAVKAFRQMLEKQPGLDTVLVVKIKNSRQHPKSHGHFLREIQGLQNQVVLIDKTLSAPEMTSLVSLCDCFVSLHRSEDFGFGMAEAMYLGKPVIATGYSGNTDFCNEDNALLVGYRPIPAGADEYPFGDGQIWADPDIDKAADYMTQLVNDEEMGRRIGRKGQIGIRTHFSYLACGLRYADRIAELPMRDGSFMGENTGQLSQVYVSEKGFIDTCKQTNTDSNARCLDDVQEKRLHAMGNPQPSADRHSQDPAPDLSNLSAQARRHLARLTRARQWAEEKP